MKPEAQRIAIAEFCGWKKDIAEQWKDGDGFYRPSGSLTYRQHTVEFKAGHPPDYLNDLNAMHEAELLLNNEQAGEFERVLRRVCFGLSYRNVISATAAQRAEALLRTIGKWVEEPQ